MVGDALALDSPRWSELEHAYGNAADVPDLLRQLGLAPSRSDNDEPWFTLWSSLAHQDDVYSASFAAVPHVINVMARSPDRVTAPFFNFPAWVEICRVRSDTPIPDDLRGMYFDALHRLPELAAEASKAQWDRGFLTCALAAIAAAKGDAEMAEAVLELSEDGPAAFLEWHYAR
ncbi:hypothetical protein [Herbiconiux sp. UC225_62]|uniref:hypothetical protein n=1 Tax=Herbiconiux sp. UC225_62 TaxID=3350168 RepID=UPI0036D3C14C